MGEQSVVDFIIGLCRNYCNAVVQLQSFSVSFALQSTAQQRFGRFLKYNQITTKRLLRKKYVMLK